MTLTGRLIGGCLWLALAGGVASAQRSRTVGESPQPANEESQQRAAATPTPAPAPQSVKAKYEGGLFGYPKKADGILTFDDVNDRLVFRNERQAELFSLSYASIVAAFADTQSKRPTATRVIGSASIYTLPALLIKKKYRYLTLQYKDPDTQATGITSFKLGSKELLASVLNSLASKSGLTARGEVYVRRRDGATP